MYLGKIESGKSYKKFYIFFILLSLAVLGGIVYVTMARATIAISPRKVRFAADFETRVREQPEEQTDIPGKVLALETEESRIVTTRDTQGFEAEAKGKVTIFNQREKDQPLLPRTRLLSESGILFRTDKRVVVPAGGKVEVTITADKEGKEGNIGPQHFTVVNIWKAWQDKIYAESYETMTGGYTELPYVYGHTIDKALDMLSEQLYRKAILELNKKISSQEKILEKATKHEILEFSSSTEPETQIDKFNIKIKTRTVALVFNEEKLKNIAVGKIEEVSPKDKEFLGVEWESFHYNLKTYDLENKTAELSAHLEGQARAKVSANLFKKDELVGLDRYEIKKYFERFEDVGQAEVYFKPFWVHKVPSMLDHFEIQIRE